MRKPTRVTVAKPGQYTPEEIRAGIASGRMKEIGMDDRVDIREGAEFIVVPKEEPKFMVGEGVWTKIPEGLEHRILDYVSSRPASPKHRSFLHNAHHFAFGPEASQSVMLLASEPEFLAPMAEFAPHPFDEYTVSLWTGSDLGLCEMLVAVHVENGEHYAECFAMVWGEDEIIQYRTESNRTWTRSDTLAAGEDAPPDQRMAWLFNDAFRLLLAQPKGVTINRGPGNRTAIRKGKRVTFYSKSEIKIDLDAKNLVRPSFRDGSGKIMPVYQYRAHLCHSGGTRGCEHVWIRDEERENPYWTCEKCDRRRWHRKSGVRGSAEVGYVRQTYKVVKGQDQ